MWLVGDHFIFIQANVNDGPERLFKSTRAQPTSASCLRGNHRRLAYYARYGARERSKGGGGEVKIVPFFATVQFASIRRANVPGSYTPEGNLYGLFPFEAGGSLSHLSSARTPSRSILSR